MIINEELFKIICKRIEHYQKDMVRLQFDLTSIPAISPDSGGSGEYEKARFLFSTLKSMGFEKIEQLDAPDERVPSGVRPNLVLRIPGKAESQTVWILTHMDIVPAGELSFWHHNPFEAYIKEGRIYGRGVEDNQQDMVASIFAAKAFLDEGITPEKSLGLAFVADEETSSQYGLSSVLVHEMNPFKKNDIIVVPDSGNEEGSLIEIAEKSMLWLRFKTIGKQSHGSRPSSGRNAFLAASHLVVELSNLPHEFNAYDSLYDPPISTFQPTKKEANIPNINTIPGEDIFYMDCRVLPQYSLSNLMDRIRCVADAIQAAFDVTVEITPVQKIQAPSPTLHNAPVVSALQEAIRDVYSVEAVPGGVGAGTIAAFLRCKGYPVAVWSKVTQTAHQPNENCLIANMIGNAKVYAHLFLQK
jgi:succinyl-diaminopimelate desuccinylase